MCKCIDNIIFLFYYGFKGVFVFWFGLYDKVNELIFIMIWNYGVVLRVVFDMILCLKDFSMFVLFLVIIVKV